MTLPRLIPKRSLYGLIKAVVLVALVLLLVYAAGQALREREVQQALNQRLEEEREAFHEKDDFGRLNEKEKEPVDDDEDEKGKDEEEDVGQLDKMDWHDWDAILADASRQGLGEQGEEAKLTDEESRSPEYNKLYSANGFNGLLSDKISYQRAVPDIRHKQCRERKYISDLPSASIIIPIFNEHFSTLMRSIYSIINRSPSELVHEILLVDDHSEREDCHEKLDKYLADHGSSDWEDKVRLIRLKERVGLIGAKIAGAKAATGKVLIFLDSHIEANYNWLPPLLEPLALDKRTAVCPFIDVVDEKTLAYRAQDEGARGSFDWRMDYKRLPRNSKEAAERPADPFDSPVMAGGLFAMWADHFWELGGYDPGLQIWGGEQYELSFKIWMCGGRMVDAPCSRVGHIYRKFGVFAFGNVLGKNIKRVAEVWMDDYKKYVYQRHPHYQAENAGDLSQQRAIRSRLQCKSFRWFMEKVAYDQDKHYPAVVPKPYASGLIRSKKDPRFCVEASFTNKITLALCNEKSKMQKFEFTYKNDVKILGKSNTCWDLPTGQEIQQYACHGQQGNQMFRYDHGNFRIIRPSQDLCLDCDLNSKKLFMARCDSDVGGRGISKTQQWTLQNVDEERLKEWKELSS